MPETNTTAATSAETPAWKAESDQRYKDLTDKLQTGMKELFSSDKYADYLKSMSKFHNYSSRNVMLIHQQMPNATKVASFKLWDEGFNRKVKKGEKSLRIFAPIKTEPEKKMMEKLDPETGTPMLDKDGKVIMEEMTAINSGGIKFKLVPVFDVSQTYGEPLPELVEDLTGSVAHYEAFIDTLKAVSPLPIEFEPMKPEQDGYCRYGEKIGIREGMSEVQTVSAIVHEITHARLHDKNNKTQDEAPKSKEVKEIEAESISYVVCQKYGLETGANSFGYLATWGSHDMKEIQTSLDTIRKEANTLINTIDSRFAIICKERGIDLNPAEQQAEQPQQAQPTPAPDKPVEPEFTTESTTENIAGVDFSFVEVKPVMPEQERQNTIEHSNYQKLAALFPQVENGEYSYLRMEAGTAMMPLSVEWIGDSQLSIMHTYTQNGDLMYDPMITLEVGKEAKTATAVEFQQSNPPLYQRVDEDGIGHSIDGNGNERTINDLQGQLGDFTLRWLENIGNQGYIPERANMFIDGEDVRITFDKDGAPVMPEPPQQTAEPLPDTTITPADRDAFGYTAEDMLPLNTDRAVELFNNDHAVFLLYPDNTEAMAFEVDEISAHDGIFGIEREDWQKSQEYRVMDNDTNRQQEAVIESGFIGAKEDTFAIYQIMDGAEKTSDYRFEGLNSLEQRGLEVNRNNYVIVHTEPLQQGQTLEGIFQKFNLDRPADFSGHSLSVSDVIVLNQGGEITSHFVDSFGFSELPAFLGVEKQPEHTAPAVEQDTPSVTEFQKEAPPAEPPLPDIPKNEIPVYIGYLDEAVAKDEKPQFVASQKLNHECAEAIDRAINENSKPGPMAGTQYVDVEKAARSVVDEFGAERVAWALAGNVKAAEFDGRWSNATKDWAKDFDVPSNSVYHLNTHRTILESFVGKFREVEKEKPSLMDAIKAGEEKSRKEHSNAQPKLDTPEKTKKKTGMEV
jgi:hypothetical protein